MSEYFNTNKFRKVAQEKNLSMKAIAIDTGLSVRTVYNLEHGKKDNFSIKTVRTLEKYLELNKGALIL